MALQITGQAQGLVLNTSQKAGSPAAISTGWNNEVMASELLPRYASLALAGVVYSVQFASGSAAAPSATAAGAFAFYNPINSGKNLVMIDAVVTLATGSVQTTSFDYGLAAWTNQNPTSVTPGNTPQNVLVGSANASVAKTATVATIVGGQTTAFRQLASFYVDLAAGDFVASIKDEIAGAVIVAPGSGIDMVAITTAGTATQVLSYTWAELPI